MTAEKTTLDELVRDASELLEPGMMGSRVDWEKVDEKLFARIEREAKGIVAMPLALSPMKLETERGSRWSRGWATAAAAIAIAAAIPMFMGAPAHSTTAPFETAVVHESRAERLAGALAWKEGAGDVRFGAAKESGTSVMAAGTMLERGDVAETHGVRAVFERRAPHGENEEGALAVTWALEDTSRFLVKGTHGALILGLERGAVEAQVTPVPNGEAFAVDVDGARVAVHGTHLRVARDGSHVTVDLTEGVVSIGAPPRSGSTYGKLVNAPAHIEFDANDPAGTLKVTHAPDRVRQAIALRPAPETLATVTPRAQIVERHAAPPAAVMAPVHAPAPVAAVPTPAAAAATPAVSAPAAPAAPAIDTHPEQTIANAVRECMRANGASHPDDVVVTVTSTLELRVGAEGNVEIAKFVPPLEPEVQTCASRAIYKARFASSGNVSIPLDLRR